MTISVDERALIMHTALSLMSRQDGGSVAVGAILAEAGLSTRAFYRHFAAKDDLLLALVREEGDEVTRRLARAAERARTAERALAAYVHGMLQITARPHQRKRAMLLGSENVQRARGLAAERHRFQLEQEAVVARILENGRDSGDFPWAEPVPDARQICAAVRQAFDDQLTDSSPLTAERAAEEISSFVLRALGTRRA